jgi:hypothetical protein
MTTMAAIVSIGGLRFSLPQIKPAITPMLAMMITLIIAVSFIFGAVWGRWK